MKASTYDIKNFGINSTREKEKWEMHKKEIDIKKVLKMCLKLPTKKKYSPKMHTTKLDQKVILFLKKKLHQKDQQNHSE